MSLLISATRGQWFNVFEGVVMNNMTGFKVRKIARSADKVINS